MKKIIKIFIISILISGCFKKSCESKANAKMKFPSMAFEECNRYCKLIQTGLCGVMRSQKGNPDSWEACKNILMDACRSGYDRQN